MSSKGEFTHHEIRKKYRVPLKITPNPFYCTQHIIGLSRTSKPRQNLWPIFVHFDFFEAQADHKAPLEKQDRSIDWSVFRWPVGGYLRSDMPIQF